MTSEKLLTEVELEIMQAVWKLGRCTVRDVVDTLFETRPLAYTSVATMMKILEQKKSLKLQKEDSTHFYIPLIKRETYEKKALRHLTDKIFQGSASSVFLRLLDEAEISKEELAVIKKNLNERLKP